MRMRARVCVRERHAYTCVCALGEATGVYSAGADAETRRRTEEGVEEDLRKRAELRGAIPPVAAVHEDGNGLDGPPRSWVDATVQEFSHGDCAGTTHKSKYIRGSKSNCQQNSYKMERYIEINHLRRRGQSRRAASTWWCLMR